MTPTIEEICATGWDRHGPRDTWAVLDAATKDKYRADMRAVVETHFVPMLAEAYRAAIGGSEMSHQYADRIKRLILESGK